MAETKQMLTSKQVAAMLRVDRSTVLRRGRSGELPVAFRAPGARGDVFFDTAGVVAIAEKEIAERRQAISEISEQGAAS